MNDNETNNTHGLSPTDLIIREESLTSWRFAANLTVNGLLINTLFSVSETHSKIEFVRAAVPFIGVVITVSFLLVSLLSMRFKFKNIKQNMKRNNIEQPVRASMYYGHQMLGPYILTSILLLVFWCWYFVS